jgi:glucose-1-phosphate cytidylyltransferase
MPSPEPADVPVFVLCGGLGSRLGEAANSRPKPMLDIGEKPMLLHIMSWYSRFGFRRFVLCTGHRSEAVRRARARICMIRAARPGT